MTTLPPGTAFGPYRIEAPLGQGGMGTVYRARSATGQPVALKVLSPEAAQDLVYLERFRREAMAAAIVDHPNVARCLGHVEEPGRCAIALELVTGGSLAERLKRQGPLHWRDAAAIGAQIADALHAIHEAGLVHRDLKPGNVLLDEHGGVKLTDFGIARRASSQSLTRTGEVLGTPEYMAPEQVNKAREVDGRADLYALGATLYRLVTGEPPFSGDLVSVLTRVQRDAAPRVRARVPDAPAAFDELVARLLAKSPDARPATAGEVADELEAIVHGRRASGLARKVAIALAGAALVSLGVLISTARRPPAPIAPPAAPTAPPPASPALHAEVPGWFAALPEDERPHLPLPAGLAFGKNPGEYVARRDESVVLVFVPGGEFVMGTDEVTSPEDEDAAPAHPVTLSPYFIGKHEVTNAQFARFYGGTEHHHQGRDEDRRDRGKKTPPGLISFEHPFPPMKGVLGPDHPVVSMSFGQAASYAAWLDLDLPTEAQWERAARWDPKARAPRRFAWGAEIPSDRTPRIANLIDGVFCREIDAKASNRFPGFEDGFARTAPVGACERDVSAYGLHDATGNVSEVCLDFYDPRYYRFCPRVDPCQRDVGRGEPEHATRGASWGWHEATFTLASRGRLNAGITLNTVGFRVAVRHRR